jgi:hypothetical protein
MNGDSRMKAGLIRTFAATVLPGILKPLRVLWNEIIAFFFFVMAVMAVPSIYRSVKNFNGELDVLGRILLTGTFAAVMGGYGLYSILRARKIDKS